MAWQPQTTIPVSAITIALGSLYPDSTPLVPSKTADYAMFAPVPSLRLVSPDATDNAFLAQPAQAGYQRRGHDTHRPSIYCPRPAPPRNDDQRSRATTNSRSCPASRADVSSPSDTHLDSIMADFQKLQSELATYKNAQ